MQAHGFLDRPSEDVDLFTTSAAEDQFPEALATVIAAYKADGLDVSTTAENPGFAPLQVTDQTNGATAKVELGIDWRAHQPVSSPSARFSTPTTPSRARSAPCSPEPNPATTSDEMGGRHRELISRRRAVSSAPRVGEAQAAIPRRTLRQG